MSHHHTDAAERALNRRHVPLGFTDHRAARARNTLHGEPAPSRIIEIGEVTAGIAVPEPGGVRFFASSRDFAPLDGTVFRSVEQAARAARDRFRDRTRPGRRGHEAARLRAV
jgi:transposase